MKKIGALILCIALLFSLLAGCKKQQEQPTVQQESGLSVYASFYPLYAIAEMIAADVPGVQLNCLVQPQDGCLRDYSLSDWDLSLLLNSADAVLIGGRGLESFENMLYTLGEDGPMVSSLLGGMELEHFEAANSDGENHWSGENPHIYLSTDGALALAERIAGSLMLLDDRNSALYQANLEAAREKIESLRRELHALNSDIAGESVILMHEGLLFAAKECGLEVEDFIERESGEAFYDSTLEKCIARLKENESRVILIEKQAPAAFCSALENAGFRLARMDVLSTQPESAGVQAYFDALLANGSAIQAAFAAGEDNQ